MPRLNNEQRSQAIGRLNAGQMISIVGRTLGCTMSTIQKLVDRFRHVRDYLRSGRPHVTMTQQDRFLMLTHLHQCFLPVTAIGSFCADHAEHVTG